MTMTWIILGLLFIIVIIVVIVTVLCYHCKKSRSRHHCRRLDLVDTVKLTTNDALRSVQSIDSVEMMTWPRQRHQRWISYADPYYRQKGIRWFDYAMREIRRDSTSVSVAILCETDIPEVHRSTFEHLVKLHGGKHGYSVWKPIIIQLELARLRDGDVLVYMDSRTTMRRPSSDLLDWLDQSVLVGRTPFYLDSSFCQHSAYCTGNTYREFTHLDVGDDVIQVQASGIAMIKTSNTVRLIDEWTTWCIREEGRLLHDKSGENRPSFVDTRWDQMLLTMVLLDRGVWPIEDAAMFNHWGSHYHRLVSQGKMAEAEDLLTVNGKTVDLTIVVAHYQEDLSWLDPWKPYLHIYSKGHNVASGAKVLPNVGQEGHTYLTYIVTHYSCLPRRVVFTQGRIDDHMSVDTFRQVVESNDPIWTQYSDGWKHTPHRYEWKLAGYGGSSTSDSGGNFGHFWDKHLSRIGVPRRTDELRVWWNAVFSVDRSRIWMRPLSFYQALLDDLSNYGSNPESGHFLERMWYYIFDDANLQQP